VGEKKGSRSRKTRRVSAPAVMPEMLWPSANETHASDLEPPGLRASRRNHPSMWARRLERSSEQPTMPDPRVILVEGRDIVDLSDCSNPCGKGAWCEACRSDIRMEALRWLRELNVVRATGTGPVLAWSRAWNQDLLLADR
jgi:hypothetical protein